MNETTPNFNVTASADAMTGETYLALVRGGAAALQARRDVINDLNVFPVPDGDTGDNMYFTVSGGVGAAPTDDIGVAAASVAHGMLLGARGNSGVILSRFFAGIAKALQGVQTADLSAWNTAVTSGVKEAYAAVTKPVEGTVLTVMRCASEAAAAAAGARTAATFAAWFDVFEKAARKALDKTPEQLEVLKQAGVVDSGGAGFVCIINGMHRVICGEAVESASQPAQTNAASVPAQVDLSLFGTDDVLTYGYCTEFLLRLQASKVDINAFDVNAVADFLNAHGNSVVCFADGSILKAHVHTMHPGEILNEMQKYGEFLTMKVENMSLQHNGTEAETKNEQSAAPADDLFDKPVVKHKRFATVAVAAGEGIKDLFRESGADVVVDGGQSMNPSTADFLAAFETVNADVILVYPNNGNIIMAAEQAASLYEKSRVRVLKTKSIGAGYAALSMLDISSDDEETVVQGCLDAMEGVVTGLVSPVSRDAEQNGFTMHPGQFIGYDAETEDVLAVADTPEAALSQLAVALDAACRDVVIALPGLETPAQNASEAFEALQQACPCAEVISAPGGMPIYRYALILE